MTQWELARYLIDAKKCVDSLIFISDNISGLHNINLREKCDNVRQKFYINLCVVLDETLGKKKKEICKNDNVIGRIYYERDKNSAHKDSSYRPRKYSSLQEEVGDKKKEILHTRQCCKECLPEVITLDFVSHDKELFRIVHRLNAQIEQDANLIKYPMSVFHSYQLSEEGRHVFKAFDTEKQDRETERMFRYDYDKMIERMPLSSVDDIKEMTEEEKRRSAVIVENGINSYEGLQNRQDFCIQSNILFKQDMWVSLSENSLKMVEELKPAKKSQ